MNNDLIDRQAAVEIMYAKANMAVGTDGQIVYESAARMIERMPAVDAQPVRHGEWICEIEPNAVTASGRVVHVFRCSCCDFTWANKAAVLHYFRHCPNCGAKMDAEVENDE